jgi:DNA gyrase/topoisomerase IV subunit A
MTQKGKIIKQKLSDYKNKRIIQAITLNENDRVADVALVKGKQYIFNSCNNGLGKIFSSDTIPTTSLLSKGKGVSCCKFINNADIELCCLDCCQFAYEDISIQSDISFLLISSQGRIRKMEVTQRYFRDRNSYGSTLINLTENEFVIHSSFITNSDNILLITAKGNVARIDLSLIDKIKFYKKGIKLSDDDIVVACCKISRPQKIILNSKKLDIYKQETEKSQALLTDIFVDIEELKPEIKSNTDSLNEMLILLFTKEIWNKDDLDSICKSKGLILGAVLEEINDYSYSKIDNAVIEDNGDEIFVVLDYKNELL